MVFFTRRFLPVTGTSIGNLDEGAIITLNENASPVEFYVAKQDYEAGLNGAGRVLVVRKDVYDDRVWDAGNVNAYATSDIDTWFNGTYKGLLDPDVQEATGTTKFYYTHGNDNWTVGTLERAVFALSATELGQSASWFNVEGSALPIASTLQVAHLNGSANTQWTRSPYTLGANNVAGLNSSGTVYSSYCNKSSGSRPTFTLPATFKLSDSQIIP